MSDSTTGQTRRQAQWDIAPDVTYLNHGSFGPSPRAVLAARTAWMRKMEANPMDFFIRRLGGLLDEAAVPVAKFLGCPARTSPSSRTRQQA